MREKTSGNCERLIMSTVVEDQEAEDPRQILKYVVQATMACKRTHFMFLLIHLGIFLL